MAIVLASPALYPTPHSPNQAATHSFNLEELLWLWFKMSLLQQFKMLLLQLTLLVLSLPITCPPETPPLELANFNKTHAINIGVGCSSVHLTGLSMANSLFPIPYCQVQLIP